MSEERVVVKEKSILLDRILPIIFCAAMIVSIFLWQFKKEIYMGFCLFSFGAVGSYLLCPLIQFFSDAASGTSEKLLMRGVKLFLKGTFMAFAIYTGYRIMFTYPIIKDREYWLYNLVVLIGLILIFIDFIKRIRRTFISMKLKEDEGYEKLLMGIIGGMLLILPTIRMYNLCIYKNTVDLSQTKKPYGIMFKIMDSEEHKITENELISQFYNELVKIKVENMRGIDSVNYIFWQDKSKLLLEIHPMYKSPNGKSENDFNFEDGYIYKIEVYEKDIVLLLFQNKNGNYRVTKYHIQLSKELVDEFLKLKEKQVKQ